MEFEREFNQNLKQFIQLLKNILSTHFPPEKLQSPEPNAALAENVHLNLCFFNFFASEEGSEGWEDGEESSFHAPEPPTELRACLSRADLEFLRRNGIRF